MWKNVCNRSSVPSVVSEKGQETWYTSLDWLFASGKVQSDHQNTPQEKNSLLSAPLPDDAREAEEGISQVQDPLWQKVCIDILRTLGPLAFKNLWKANLIYVSHETKKAYFICPTRDIAASLQRYHFVIIGVLKKFYPFLMSLNIEVKEEGQPLHIGVTQNQNKIRPRQRQIV